MTLGDEDEIVFCRYLCTSVLGEMWCNEDCSLVEILKLNFGHNMEFGQYFEVEVENL